jgi:anti-anti-sigma factor
MAGRNVRDGSAKWTGWSEMRETRVTFDFAGLTHADSAALGAIVRRLAKLKDAGGALRIAAAQPMIDHSLTLTKVDMLIEMFPSLERAARGFFLPDASTPQRS